MDKNKIISKVNGSELNKSEFLYFLISIFTPFDCFANIQ